MLIMAPVFVFADAALAATATPQDRVEMLLRGGAPGLALTVMDREQPAIVDPPAWSALERLRIATYGRLEQWQKLFDRVQALPPSIDIADATRLRLLGARWLISSRHGAQARTLLREVLWHGPADRGVQGEARRLVIEAYLADDQVKDALIAIDRYVPEFSPSDRAWPLLHARVLLRAGDAAGAARALAANDTQEGRALFLLASLRSGGYKPGEVIAQARRLAGSAQPGSGDAARDWAVVAEAAAGAGDPRVRVEALEHALPQPDRLLAIPVDQLWDAYVALGEAIGNEGRILIGDDAAWFARAGELEKKRHAIEARAVYALLALRSTRPQAAEDAHRALVESLLHDRLGGLARALYLDSERFGEPARMPASARYLLADRAVSDRDPQLAARLVLDLREPPPWADAHDWDLKRARLAVYSGAADQAAGLVRDYMKDHPDLDEARADEVAGVLFDMQAVGQHERALELFGLLREHALSRRVQREVLYWMADSASALNRFEQAAEWYLDSAVHDGADPTDMWGQSARYQAAGALARAGLRHDAERVYTDLLGHTTDPKRRAIIERELQQLWLIAPQGTTH